MSLFLKGTLVSVFIIGMFCVAMLLEHPATASALCAATAGIVFRVGSGLSGPAPASSSWWHTGTARSVIRVFCWGSLGLGVVLSMIALLATDDDHVGRLAVWSLGLGAFVILVALLIMVAYWILGPRTYSGTGNPPPQPSLLAPLTSPSEWIEYGLAIDKPSYRLGALLSSLALLYMLIDDWVI